MYTNAWMSVCPIHVKKNREHIVREKGQWEGVVRSMYNPWVSHNGGVFLCSKVFISKARVLHLILLVLLVTIQRMLQLEPRL